MPSSPVARTEWRRTADPDAASSAGRGRASVDAAAAADFVLWPGAAAWPPFESGELVRVTLPLDALPALGVAPPAAADAVVQADVLVGQDGFARAIRLVQ